MELSCCQARRPSEASDTKSCPGRQDGTMDQAPPGSGPVSCCTGFALFSSASLEQRSPRTLGFFRLPPASLPCGCWLNGLRHTLALSDWLLDNTNILLQLIQLPIRHELAALSSPLAPLAMTPGFVLFLHTKLINACLPLLPPQHA